MNALSYLSLCLLKKAKYLHRIEITISVQFSSVQSLSNVRLCDAMNCSTPGLPIHHKLWEFFPSPGDLSNPEIKSRSPILHVDSLPAESQGKPKNTGVGSLSLLQHIFPTQELNWGLLHCRQILYQLSYQGR